MARSGFSSTIRLETAEQPVLDYPFTVSIHYNVSAFNTFPYLWSLGNTGVTTDYLGVLIENTTGKIVTAISNAAVTPPGATTTTGATVLNTDNVATAVFASATDRRAFLNGGSKGTDTTSCAMPAGLNIQEIGVLRRTTVTDVTSGKLAHLAIWNAALSDAEVAQLGQRVDPRKVRPDRLIRYYPLNARQTSAPEADVLGKGTSFLSVGAISVQPQPPVTMAPAVAIRRRLEISAPASLDILGTLELCGAITTIGGVSPASANPGAFFAVL